MKETETRVIKNDLNDYSEYLVNLIKGSLDKKDYRIKLTARNDLVRIGKSVIPKMHKLLESENYLLRLEAARVVELIADIRSIPVLINLLDDTVFEIRWIAAEGLIKIGRRSICPLLKSIRDGKSSFFFNRAARHALLNLVNENEKEKLMPLLLSLGNYHYLSETAPVQASIALINVFKNNS